VQEVFSIIPSRTENAVLTCHAAEHCTALMAFSLRQGGCSPVPFDSLNFSVSQGDSRENVRRNFATLGAHLNLDPGNILTCRQVHGDRAIIVDSPPSALLEADAVLTPAQGLFPAIKTADCLPILLLDPVRRIAGAIHAGWRGTVLRIVKKVLDIMSRNFGSQPGDLIAALGPAIGPCCYEVDDAVLTPFRQAVPRPDRFIRVHVSRKSGSGQTPHLDLTATNRWELISAGVLESNLHTVNLCTCCRRDVLFSHRRDGFRSGRHVALVGFRE
jgi:polyphenol oxidase